MLNRVSKRKFTRSVRTKEKRVVPVLDSNRKPLMPCSEKRARLLMTKGQAKAFWQKGIFCIILTKEPSSRSFQDVCVAVDPGSKREGYTVATQTKIVLNILTDSPGYDVKKAVELRKILRRSKRSRKTPYRKCRFNRRIGGIPPSTKARWCAKLRIIKHCIKLIPITGVNVEDIQAITKKGSRKWNASFSPLQVGKEYFYKEIRNLGVNLFLTQGYETKEWRVARGFSKTNQKLKDTWEAHNVDSHVLCELVSGSEIKPFKGIIRLDFLNFSRRQTHVSNFKKGHERKQYGGTRSLGVNRGTLVKHHKYGISYIGGSSKGLLSLHNVENGKRYAQNVKKSDIKILSNNKWRTAFLSALKGEVSGRKVKR